MPKNSYLIHKYLDLLKQDFLKYGQNKATMGKVAGDEVAVFAEEFIASITDFSSVKDTQLKSLWFSLDMLEQNYMNKNAVSAYHIITLIEHLKIAIEEEQKNRKEKQYQMQVPSPIHLEKNIINDFLTFFEDVNVNIIVLYQLCSDCQKDLRAQKAHFDWQSPEAKKIRNKIDHIDELKVLLDKDNDAEALHAFASSFNTNKQLFTEKGKATAFLYSVANVLAKLFGYASFFPPSKLEASSKEISTILQVAEASSCMDPALDARSN
ncbi:hypothetical protein [Legionella feeleii]|uniref:Uncharacterized protein n=1 Tax=Legionella feeleii TaxID=453 RepID=A0A378KJX1_9GAMM|nr:hypothetical protein [Legionella feeleii]STX88235.1 Uncharacterised protein [Legionella feeleii]